MGGEAEAVERKWMKDLSALGTPPHAPVKLIRSSLFFTEKRKNFEIRNSYSLCELFRGDRI